MTNKQKHYVWCMSNADLEALNRKQDLAFIVHYRFATFELNIYIKFRKMRQGSQWKPIRLMKRTLFKNI